MPAFILPFLFKALGIGRAFLGFLRSLSPQALIILALCALLAVQTLRVSHTAKQRDRALAGLKTARQGIEDLRLASLKALAEAQANKARVETRYVEIKDASQTAISARLRSELDRLRAASAAHQGGADATGVSGPAGAAADPLGRDQATVLDDAKICAANTVKAEGWQDIYRQWAAIPLEAEITQ